MSDTTESPAFLKESTNDDEAKIDEGVALRKTDQRTEGKKAGETTPDRDNAEDAEMLDEHKKPGNVFDGDDDDLGGGDDESPGNNSLSAQFSEAEETIQDQLKALQKSFRIFEKENKALKQALVDHWQKPFQNGSRNLIIGTTSCRTCLYRCEYGGIYLTISLEDVDAFLASEAAENSRTANGCSREDSMIIKRDWLNTIALGDIEVDCRWTGEGRRDLRISNGEKSYHIASLCSEGFVLGRSGLRLPRPENSSAAGNSDSKNPWLPSLIEFRPFNRLKYLPWIYEFPVDESLAACECSGSVHDGFIACVTHNNILRIFGLGGTLCHTELLPPTVCLSAAGDLLGALCQVHPGRSQIPNMLEPTPLHHEGKQVSVILEDSCRITQAVYKVLIWKIDTHSKCPVEQVDCSPELYSSQIRWFGLTGDAPHIPVIINANSEAIALSYSAVQSGYLPRQLNNYTSISSDDYFAEHAEVASSAAAAADTRQDSTTRLLTKYSDARRCEGYIASWLPVARNLETLKLKDFIVHSCSTKYMDLLPLSTSFVCHPLTRVYFQIPLCLPPALIALRSKYPIDLHNIIAFNTLSKEEKLSRGFNPLTSHFLDEQTVRNRDLTLLPILRNAAWRPAGGDISNLLIESFFEAKSLVEVASTQGALIALQDGNVSAFSQCLSQVDNEKALTLIERQVKSNKNSDFAKAWAERFDGADEVGAMDGGDENQIRDSLMMVESLERGREISDNKKVGHRGERSSLVVEPSEGSGRQSQAATGTGPASMMMKTDLASLISGSIDLRNNTKKRRMDF